MPQELALPNPLEPIRDLVLHAVSSPLTRVMYGHAMDELPQRFTAGSHRPEGRALANAWSGRAGAGAQMDGVSSGPRGAQVEHLDEHGEGHGEVDVAFGDVPVERLNGVGLWDFTLSAPHQRTTYRGRWSR